MHLGHQEPEFDLFTTIASTVLSLGLMNTAAWCVLPFFQSTVLHIDQQRPSRSFSGIFLRRAIAR